MPIYEYNCPACGARFELIRQFTDSDRDLKCPKCGAHGPQRAVSRFSNFGGDCSPNRFT